MMIVGYDFISDDDSVSDTRIRYENINNVTINGAIYDELLFKNGADEYSEVRDLWNYATVLLARFSGNLNAGNIDLGNQQTNYIEIRKRKIEDLNDWQLVGKMPYGHGKKFFYYDDLVEAGQTYEYALVPIAYDELGKIVEGEPVKKEVTVDFEDVFLIGKNRRLRLRYDIRQSNVERITRKAVIEPLGSRYPVIISNATLDYYRGSLKTKLISDMNRRRIQQGQDINRRSEYQYIDKTSEFLADKNKKLLKFPNGATYLVNTIETVPLEYSNDWQNTFADISFEWTETGEINEENLIKSGLVDD